MSFHYFYKQVGRQLRLLVKTEMQGKVAVRNKFAALKVEVRCAANRDYTTYSNTAFI